MAGVAKVWHLQPHNRAAIADLAQRLDVPAVVAQLLLNRGITDPEEARYFLDTPWAGLRPPEDLPGIVAAVDLLETARQKRWPVCIYGDYDVDGVTGSTILQRIFQLLGIPVLVYIPHRLDEGYGLNEEALRTIVAKGAKLIVTVDCGIASIKEARLARHLGIPLIITDHHEFKDELPTADVLVHPRLPGTNYPFGGLSGAGVAFKLAWALCTRASGGGKVSAALRDGLLDGVALAALGLIADVVPLHSENRIFVRHGLQRLQKAPSLGLRALMESAKVGTTERVRAEDISFRLAPRINAAGRLGDAQRVVELLTTTSAQRAAEIAFFLEEQNATRQLLERKIVTAAKEQVSERGWENDPALVLYDAGWHGGVIGIVAGRLADYFARPTVVLTKKSDSDVATGSGRSIPGFALHTALHACTNYLQRHGGHAAAAGLGVHLDQLDAFRAAFCAYTQAHFPTGLPAPRLTLDAELPLPALTFGLLKDLDRLEPYGANNPKPKFLAGDLQIVDQPRRMGVGEKHLSFRVRQGQQTLRAVAFGLGERYDELMSENGKCCLAFTPKRNEWNGNTSIELDVVDFQAGATARLA